MHLDPPFGELGSHHVRSAMLFQAQLRIGVQIAADLGKLVLIAGDGIKGVSRSRNTPVGRENEVCPRLPGLTIAPGVAAFAIVHMKKPPGQGR
jgi:hypothetical protein